MNDLRELAKIFKHGVIHIKDAAQELNYAKIKYSDGTSVVIWKGNGITCLRYGKTQTVPEIVDSLDDIKKYDSEDVILVLIDTR